MQIFLQLFHEFFDKHFQKILNFLKTWDNM